MSRRTSGYVIAMTGIAFWSTTGVFLGHLLTAYKMPALLLALWRDGLVCVALAPALLLVRRPLLRVRASQISFLALYGLILALFNSAWILSIKANGAAVGTVLGYSSAGFAVILAWWLFRESLSPAKIVAVVLSLGGCALVSNAFRPEVWQLNPVGIAAGLLSGLLFAGYSLMGKEASLRAINPWTALLYSFAFGTLFLAILNMLPPVARLADGSGTLLPSLPPQGWLLLVVLAFVPTLLGYGLYTWSLNYLPAGIANLLATSEPVMTAVQAYLLLGERMTAVQIVGSAIILSAVLLVRWGKE